MKAQILSYTDDSLIVLIGNKVYEYFIPFYTYAKLKVFAKHQNWRSFFNLLTTYPSQIRRTI